jgi:hypothetical protein
MITETERDGALEYALQLGAHALTRGEYKTLLLDIVLKSASVRFAALESGHIYFYNRSGRERNIYRIGEISPKRKKCQLAVFGGLAQEAFASSLPGEFHEIAPRDAELATLQHLDIVIAAKKAALEIPPQVRREYPQLFVMIPSGFKAEDVASILTGWKKFTNDSVPDLITETLRQIVHHDRSAAPLAVFCSAGLGKDVNAARESLLNRLAFYRWLEPRCAPGGVFHVPVKLEEVV